jgi:hypothetical protein
VSDNEIKILGFLAICLGMLLVFVVGHLILRGRKQNVEETPVTEEGLQQFDDLPPGIAVILAWSEPGDNPKWHYAMQDVIRGQMPVLARALDRLVKE